MSKTVFCIQLSRTLIVLLTLIFITLSQMKIFNISIIPWPNYHQTVAIILDLVLVIGLISSLTQHLKLLIFFSWLSALTFLLIFFGNTVSSQYQSDLIGKIFVQFSFHGPFINIIPRCCIPPPPIPLLLNPIINFYYSILLMHSVGAKFSFPFTFTNSNWQPNQTKSALVLNCSVNCLKQNNY